MRRLWYNKIGAFACLATLLCLACGPACAGENGGDGRMPRLLVLAGWHQEHLTFAQQDANTVFAVQPAQGPYASLLLQFALPGEAFVQTGISLRQLQLNGRLVDPRGGLPPVRSRLPALDLPLMLGWRVALRENRNPSPRWTLVPATGLQLGFLGSGLERTLPDAPLRFVPQGASSPRLVWDNSLALEHRFARGHCVQLRIHYAAGLLGGRRIGTLRWNTSDRNLDAEVLSKGSHWRIGLAYGFGGKPSI